VNEDEDEDDKLHAIMVVGFGTLNGINYWRIRNSWGPNWGRGGYAKILRYSSTVENTYYIIQSVIYAT
jgi:cathepsin L